MSLAECYGQLILYTINLDKGYEELTRLKQIEIVLSKALRRVGEGKEV